MIQNLLKLRHAEPSRHINYLKIPVSNFDITKEGAEQFNKY